MDLFEVFKTRRSMRAFTDQPVEAEKLQAILEAINLAPSAGNLQGYEVFVVHSKPVREAIAKAAYDQEFIVQAPVALVFCANPARSAERYGERGKTLYCVQDATIACTHAHLAAVALGLSSVWVGAYDDDGVRQAIGIGKELRPVAVLPIGYGARSPKARPRRELADLVHEIR